MTGSDARLGYQFNGLYAKLPMRLDFWQKIGSGAEVWSSVKDANGVYWLEVDNVPALSAAELRWPPFYGAVDRGYIQGIVECEFDAADLPTSRGVEAFIIGNIQADGRGYTYGAGYESIDPDNPVNAQGFVDPFGIYSMASENPTAWADEVILGATWSNAGTQRGYMDENNANTVAGADTTLNGEIGSMGIMAWNDGAIAPLRTGYARFRELAVCRLQTITFAPLLAGLWVLVGTLDGRVRAIGGPSAGSISLDMQPFNGPFDFVQVWDGDPDGAGNLELTWFPPGGIWGGANFEWSVAGWVPETIVSAIPPTGSFETLWWGAANLRDIEWLASDADTWVYERTIRSIPTTMTVAKATLTVLDALGDPPEIAIFTLTLPIDHSGPEGYVRINGPAGIADVQFVVPPVIAELIGTEAKPYQLQLVMSNSEVYTINNGYVQAASESMV